MSNQPTTLEQSLRNARVGDEVTLRNGERRKIIGFYPGNFYSVKTDDYRTFSFNGSFNRYIPNHELDIVTHHQKEQPVAEATTATDNGWQESNGFKTKTFPDGTQVAVSSTGVFAANRYPEWINAKLSACNQAETTAAIDAAYAASIAPPFVPQLVWQQITPWLHVAHGVDGLFYSVLETTTGTETSRFKGNDRRYYGISDKTVYDAKAACQKHFAANCGDITAEQWAKETIAHGWDRDVLSVPWGQWMVCRQSEKSYVVNAHMTTYRHLYESDARAWCETDALQSCPWLKGNTE
jgi:hypothetical protein